MLVWELTPCTVEGMAAWRLASPAVEAIVVPGRGGKIVSLRDRRTDREWLWRNPSLPWRTPAYDAPFSEHDTGGIDDCFPTVAACPYPLEPWAGTPVPDHGEVWPLAWSAEPIMEREPRLRLRVAGVRFPYILEREVAPLSSGDGIRLHYRLHNTGTSPFAFIWSLHALLAPQPGMRLLLPPVARYRSFLSQNDFLGPPESEHTWPLAGGRDLSFIPGPEAGYWAKTFALRPAEEEAIAQDPNGDRLVFRFPVNAINALGLYLNIGGGAPAGVPPYYVVGLEPSIGAPDDVLSAVEDWHEAGWVKDGEVAEWWVEMRCAPR
jgi:galactose mutarotase-like enzyme